MVTPLILGVLAVVCAGPLPALLGRMSHTRATPRSAMVAWQATALAASLAALGAPIALFTTTSWPRAEGPLAWTVGALALALALLVVIRLLVVGHRVGVALRRARREHHDAVDLLAESIEVEGHRVTHLDHDAAFAYCVPGILRSRTVVTAGVLAHLSAEETRAVLAHEQAHLRARHDLVIEAFTVLRTAFPKLLSGAAALSEVRLLAELLADRAAARRTSRMALGRALLTVGSSGSPHGSMSFGGHLGVRARLLADTRSRPLQAAALLTLAAAVLLAPTVLVVFPWISAL